MTGEKIKEVATRYADYLNSMRVEPFEWKGWLVDHPHVALGHIATMPPKIIQFVDEGRLDKAFRWLGFMQGVLWMMGDYSIDDLANHNRP